MQMLELSNQGSLSARAQLVQRISARLPVTAEGLPVGYYRSDLLPPDDVNVHTSQDDQLQSVKEAFVELSYEHGYPTLPSGEPFWHRLEFEPALAYNAFQIYLELAKEKPRALHEVTANTQLQIVLGEQQKLDRAATPAELLLCLHEYSVTYYWPQRARAYDLFREAAYRHIRVQRAMAAEDHHYVLSEQLLAKLEEYLSSPAFLTEMSPKVAIDALKALVAIQRISAGLPSGGPLSAKEAPEATQFEAILRSIVQKESAQGRVHPQDNGGGRTSRFLKDPLTARMVQELIIRVTNVRYGEPERESGGTVIEQGVDGSLDVEDVQFHGDLVR